MDEMGAFLRMIDGLAAERVEPNANDRRNLPEGAPHGIETAG